ncbi:MAG: acetate--CoA ligase [candidate division Zixibacteria bacterium]|nr:acetate--CoA ligase [candidate division Zixibacteria bacterium]MBU1470638.1 acetate--CoA ligase [candidate division Zixibacteria bacterium]MBU2624141.1 acetate--CoA ligase [candidate division Zixibacteria bacterium]
MKEHGNIETLLHESRLFSPSDEFRHGSHMGSIDEFEAKYKQSIDDPEGFWAEAAEELHWFRRWDRVLNSDDAPFFRWFENGKTNISFNCLDRHLTSPTRNKAAIIWEGEPGDKRVLTYWDISREVNKFANALKSIGIRKGDRVAIYLPMIPELAISMLACARIGAIHSVIFAGFSAESIRDRILDCQAKLVITADGSWRRGNVLPLKNIVDDAVNECDCVSDVIVVRRSESTTFPCHIKEGRDHWYHRLVDMQSYDCPAEKMDSEDMLFLLYTSGTTGKPKGVVHTTGGYMVYTHCTSKYVFDLKPEDVFWCTADIGWVTGHSYVVYGPLANAATCLMYEGSPDWPDRGRFWQLVDRYGVTIFYTAPTLIRTFMRWGDHWPANADISTLRLLGTVGEPINPEAWIWYHKNVGKEKCPIVDTWWQTETGGILITPLPGCIETKPGSATRPFFGIDADVINEEGDSVEAGLLAIKKPWPGMLRGIYGDPERFKETYWSKWPGVYFPGDGARMDEDGYFWILGRVDDVVNVSGHRIGTAELESVFVEHEAVAESAVIGIQHDIKGQALVAFVSLLDGREPNAALEDELAAWVTQKIGKFAKPERIIFSAELPKTRSGKIMRRLLRDIADGGVLGSVTTLADPTVLDHLKAKYEEN